MDETHHLRTIAHFDLDAFYVACERELNPSLIGLPVAVSQYNPYGNLAESHSSEVHKRLIVKPSNATEKYNSSAQQRDGKNGSMIAISYEARAKGVKRGDRGADAVKKCPDLLVVQVPVKRGKADLFMYRNASNRIMESLIHSSLEGFQGISFKRSQIQVEKASIDEIYIDLTIPVHAMTALILEHRRREEEKGKDESHPKANADPSSAETRELDQGMIIWNHVLRENDLTAIGGIEIMSNAARAATNLTKDEVRKGSHHQVMEIDLDEGSQTWWNRPLDQWAEVEIRLACGSALASKARNATRQKFTSNTSGAEQDVFTLSAGISSNKTLAKLASGLKKPNRQTLINPLDERSLMDLFHPLPLGRIRGLGGKLGESIMQTLDISTVGELAKQPLHTLKHHYPTSIGDEKPIADFLYKIARGVCSEEVSERTVEKSISSGKTFRGALALSMVDVEHRISDLVAGLLERLVDDRDENKRLPSLLVLGMKLNDETSHVSRSTRSPTKLSQDAYLATVLKLFHQFPKDKNDKVKGLTITASNFQRVACGEASIESAFQRSTQTQCSLSTPVLAQHSRCTTPSPTRKRAKKTTLLTMWKNKVAPTKDGPGKVKSCDNSVKLGGDGTQSKKGLARVRKKHDNGAMDQWLDSIGSRSLPKRNAEENPSQIMTYDEIDPSVLAELPFHVQAEVREQLRALRRM